MQYRRVVLAMVVLTAPALAAGLLVPDPSLSPAEVVETQLTALQSNDVPEVDAGIAQTWAFAHPENKRVTGPLHRFAQMIKGPLYRMLLDHRAHEVEEVSRSDNEAVFSVTVISRGGEVVVYEWRVARVAGGENEGAWMTTGVSLPARVGDAI